MSVSWTLIVVLALTATLPGGLVGLAAGLRLPWAAVVSLPVSFGVYGLAAWVCGLLGVGFGPVTALVAWAIALAVALVWRWVVGAEGWRRPPLPRPRRRSRAEERAEARVETRRGTRPQPRTPGVGARAVTRRWDWPLPALGVLVGVVGAVGAAVGWRAPLRDGMATVDQGWDPLWHASVVRFILETGVATPTRMGELQNIETGAHLYYPTAWHAAVALAARLTGAEVVPAVQHAAVVLPALALPVSTAALAWRIAGSCGWPARVAAALAGACVTWVPAVMWIGYFIGAWPYLVAMTACGAVLALFVVAPARPRAALPAALGLAGVLQLQPGPVTVVVLGVALWWLLAGLWRPTLPGWRRRLRDPAWLAGPGVVAAAAVAPQVLSAVGQVGEIVGYNFERGIGHAEAWHDAVTMAVTHSEEFPDFNPVPLLVVAAVGAVWSVLRRRGLWALGLWAFQAALLAHALSPWTGVPGGVLGAVASMHYSADTRLVMPVAMLTVAFAAAGLGAVVAGCGALLTRGRGPRGVVTVVLAVAVGAGCLWWSVAGTARGARWAVAENHANQRMVSAADQRAFEWLATRPEVRGGLVSGEPADGHAWAYPYAGVPTLFRHYNWPVARLGSDSDLVAFRANLLGAGDFGDPRMANAVDEAAERLDVRFIIDSPPRFWAFQAASDFISPALRRSPGLTPVFEDGGTVVYAVNQAFTDAELDRLRAESPASPRPQPQVLEDPEAQDAQAPRHHRPTVPRPERLKGTPGGLVTPAHGYLGGRLAPGAAAAGLGPELIDLPYPG